VKIAVNTRLLLKDRLEGIGQFTAEIFKRLSLAHPEVEWLFIFDRPFHADFIFGDNVKAKVLFPPTRHPLLWHWWFQIALPPLLKKENVDLFISPDGMIPLWGSTLSLPVIHDLNYHHQPKNLDIVAGSYMRYFYPKFAKKGIRVATVSKFCQKDLSETYQLEMANIDVIPNGYGHYFKPLSWAEQQQARQKFCGGKAYFLYIGALNPRKNLVGLLAAFAKYRQNGGLHQLMIVGEKMRWTAAIEEAVQNHPFKQEMQFTGRLSNIDLAQVVAAAQALCLVSHFEGFGIPILEAYACQTPVICANNTALPEVAGEGALLVDSRNANAIANAMQQMEEDGKREQLISKGQVQLKKYHWDLSAQAMWSSIQSCLSHA
jgi:glycosyltransferase involved in cell wall biosynthesis